MVEEIVEEKKFLGSAEFATLDSALSALQKDHIDIAGIRFGDPRITGGKVRALLFKFKIRKRGLESEPKEVQLAWIYM